jgi:hypothetical protein
MHPQSPLRILHMDEAPQLEYLKSFIRVYIIFYATDSARGMPADNPI